MTTSLTVLFFSTARGAVGRSELRFRLPENGLSVPELLDRLCERYPGLRPILPSSRLVRNGTPLRGRKGRLAAGDEFAIHPPYSGG